MKTAKRARRVHVSSGNIFADLGFANSEERLYKAELAHQICQAIATRGLTQEKAAELLGVDQPKISALRRGKLAGFSTDRLFQFLNDLGKVVEISIRPARKANVRGDTHVLAVV
jgi:predicted XRE-type DNA-binding protein